MNYSLPETNSDSNNTLDTPCFDDEASRVARPVVPLANYLPQSSNRKQSRTSWALVTGILLATLTGGAAGGFVLNFYLKNAKSRSAERVTANPPATSSAPVSIEAKEKALIVAAPPVESVEAEINVAGEEFFADEAEPSDEVDTDIETDKVTQAVRPAKEQAAAVPQPRPVVKAAGEEKRSEGRRVASPAPPPPPVAVASARHRTPVEKERKETQTDDNPPPLENRQEAQSHQAPAPAPVTATSQIDRVREIFEGRPRRVSARPPRNGNVDRVREIFEGRTPFAQQTRY